MLAKRGRAFVVAALAWGALCCAEPPVAQHIVLVSLDAVGAAHVGAYGYPRETTPHLDAVAQQGMLFEAAYTQQPWTLTSHLSMLTGLDPAVHGAARNRAASPAARSVASLFRDAGFSTAAFVGERVWMHPRFGYGRGFDRYEIGSDDAKENSPAILAWLDEQARAVDADPEHRFFLFAHFYDAHSDGKGPTPYGVPGAANRRFVPQGEVWGRSGGTSLLLSLHRSGEVTPRDREFLTAFYDAGVRWVDEYGLAPIVRALEEHGLAEDTLLVVTADHGEEIFEHGGVLHGQPYTENTRVPLVMRGPGISEGRRSAQLAALVDLAPTLLAQAGLRAEPAMQGLDLSPLFESDAPLRDAVYVDGLYEGERTWGSSVVADRDGERFAYVAKISARGPRGRRVFAVEGEQELYALDEDPAQERDVAREHPERTAALRRQLLAWYRANEARALAMASSPERSLVDEEEARRLEALGYLSEADDAR